MESDPFDDILGLEDKFYQEGFQLGTADGAKAGRIEGRVFGLEKGFEKYIEMGRLHGKSLVWASRLHKDDTSARDGIQFPAEKDNNDIASSPENSSDSPITLPSLPSSSRLEKHIKVLYALAETASLSTENSEDAVSDFDDRLKRAIGKVKIVEKLVGENGLVSSSATNDGLNKRQNATSGGDANIEDMSVLKARH